MALPKWENLTKEEQQEYRDKVSGLVSTIDSIEYDGFTILTGSNGGGKSLIRSQFGLRYLKDSEQNPNKRKCKSISMQLRTSTNSGWGALSAAMLDNEWTPTSLNTFQLIEGVLKAAGVFEEHEPGTIRMYSDTGFIIIDEPEIGMSEEMVLALGNYLIEIFPLLRAEKIGLMLITHSRLLVDLLTSTPPFGSTVDEWFNTFKFINLDGLGLWDYTCRIPEPANLELLKANYLFEAVRERMREVKEDKDNNKGSK